jgi:hypothetical protein
MIEFILSFLTGMTAIFYICFLSYLLGTLIDDSIRATVRKEVRELNEERARLSRIRSSFEKPSA